MIEIPSPKPYITLDQHVILNFKIRLDFTPGSLGGCGWRMAMWQCAKYLHLENIKISKGLYSLKLLKLTFQLYSNIELSQGGRQDPSWISCLETTPPIVWAEVHPPPSTLPSEILDPPLLFYIWRSRIIWFVMLNLALLLFFK